MNILICNVGSTSLKYKLFEIESARFDYPASEKVLSFGKAERIFSDRSVFTHRNNAPLCCAFPTHKEAIAMMIKNIGDDGIDFRNDISCVAFKVVHAKGVTGVQYLTEDVLMKMADFNTVAPAHNPPYIAAIKQFRELLPGIPLIGSFETGFHSGMPEEAFLYSLPISYYKEHAIRRYGFHGASHEYMTGYVLNNDPDHSRRIITCHLGGSSSITAVSNGRSVDTSLGLSLQCGIMHNNRIGDIDPYILFYMMDDLGLSTKEIRDILEKKSGFYGMSGVSGDLRDVEKAADSGNDDALNAIKSYAYSIKKYIGQYAAVLNGVDAICFAGGIGENSPLIREMSLNGLDYLGVKLDHDKNILSSPNSVISSDDSKVMIHLIRTDEEIVVARKAYMLLSENMQ